MNEDATFEWLLHRKTAVTKNDVIIINPVIKVSVYISVGNTELISDTITKLSILVCFQPQLKLQRLMMRLHENIMGYMEDITFQEKTNLAVDKGE